jgi:hypothetical protein
MLLLLFGQIREEQSKELEKALPEELNPKTCRQVVENVAKLLIENHAFPDIAEKISRPEKNWMMGAMMIAGNHQDLTKNWPMIYGKFPRTCIWSFITLQKKPPNCYKKNNKRILIWNIQSNVDLPVWVLFCCNISIHKGGLAMKSSNYLIGLSILFFVFAAAFSFVFWGDVSLAVKVSFFALGLGSGATAGQWFARRSVWVATFLSPCYWGGWPFFIGEDGRAVALIWFGRDDEQEIRFARTV